MINKKERIYFSYPSLILAITSALWRPFRKGDQYGGISWERWFMQVFLWLSLASILSVAIFTIQNSAAPPVVMKFLLWNFETSLIYTALASVGIGMLLILFLWIPRAIRASLLAKNLKKEIKFLEGEMKHQTEETKKKLKSDPTKDYHGPFQLFWEALKKFDADLVSFWLRESLSISSSAWSRWFYCSWPWWVPTCSAIRRYWIMSGAILKVPSLL